MRTTQPHDLTTVRVQMERHDANPWFPGWRTVTGFCVVVNSPRRFNVVEAWVRDCLMKQYDDLGAQHGDRFVVTYDSGHWLRSEVMGVIGCWGYSGPWNAAPDWKVNLGICCYGTEGVPRYSDPAPRPMLDRPTSNPAPSIFAS